MAMTKAAKNGLAIILFFVFVLWLWIPVKSPTTSNSAQPAKKLSLAEHLATAKRLLQKRPLNDGDLVAILQHLRAILATAPEHSEAQRLFNEARRRFEPIQRRNLARQLEADIRENPLVVVRSEWRRIEVLFPEVWWTVILRNRSSKGVTDIRYETTYRMINHTFSKGGIIAKVVPAGQTLELEIHDGVVHPDAYRASFTIVGVRYLETEQMVKVEVERERAAEAASAKALIELLNEGSTAATATVKAAAFVVFVPNASATFCLGQNPAYQQYQDLQRLAYKFIDHPPADASQAEVDEWRERLERMENAKEEEREACNDRLRKRE